MSDAIAPDWAGLEELRPTLRAYLSSRCRDENEVDDCIQETFLRAARYRSGLTDTHRLRAWAVRIAANVFLDLVRRDARHPPGEVAHEVLEMLESRESAPSDVLDKDDVDLWIEGEPVSKERLLHTIARALARLGVADRSVLGSYYSGGMSCAHTARECRIPQDLVKIRLFRARRRLLRGVTRLLAVDRNQRGRLRSA